MFSATTMINCLLIITGWYQETADLDAKELSFKMMRHNLLLLNNLMKNNDLFVGS